MSGGVCDKPCQLPPTVAESHSEDACAVTIVIQDTLRGCAGQLMNLQGINRNK